MKLRYVALGLLLLFGGLWLTAPAQAVHATGAGPGCAFVEVGAVGGGQRTHYFGNEASAPSNCVISASSELDAGASITFTYRTATSGTPLPQSPTSVILQVRFDDDNTVIRTLHSGAEPASPSTFTFWATTDGTSGGTPVAGTFRLFIQVEDDNAVNALDYRCDSDAQFNAVGASRTCTAIASAGRLRARMLVSALTASSPPAGSQFAFGTTGNEDVTCTATRDRRITVANQAYQDTLLRTIRSSDVATIKSGAAQDHTTGTTTAQAFTIDNGYDAASVSYGCQYEITGNSPLSGALWTIFAPSGHGTGITRVSDSVVRRVSLYTADPRVQWDSDGTGPANGAVAPTFTLWNRGEGVTGSGWLLNARSEQLTRSVTVSVHDATTGTQEASASRTGAAYSLAYTIAAGHQARWNEVGAPKFYRATTTGMSAVNSANSHSVSSKYRIDNDASGTPDGIATYSQSVINRADPITQSAAIANARGEYLATSRTIRSQAQGGQIEDTASVTPSSGIYSRTYTTASNHQAKPNSIGNLHRFNVSSDGNTGHATNTWGLSSRYYVDAHTQNINDLVKDNFPTANSTETFTYISGEDLIRMWGHVVNVRQDTDISTTGAPVALTLLDSNGDTVFTTMANTGGDGWTPRSQQAAVPPTGTWQFTVNVSFNGNTGQITQNIDVVSPFTGDKLSRIITWPMQDRVRIWAIVEQADSLVEPDSVPEIRIAKIDSPLSHVLPFTQMTSKATGTPVVSGSVYFFDWQENGGLPASGNYSLVIKTFVAGTPLRNQEPYEVQSMINIDGFTSSDLLEMGLWFALFLWTIHQGWLLAAGVTMMGFFRPVFDAWPVNFATAAIFMLVAIWLHAYADGFLAKAAIGERLRARKRND